MKRIAALVLLVSALLVALPFLAPASPAGAVVAATGARTPLPPALVPTGITPGDCVAPARGTVGCFARSGPRPSAAQVAHIGRQAAAALPATSSVGPYVPSQVQSMYGVPASARSTKTVAIIEAGAGQNTAAVMNFYRSYFGLPSCWSGCFTEIPQQGIPTLPYGFDVNDPTGPGWLVETDLDVEAVSATCPTCHILLVDASTSSSDDMDAAVQTAVAHGADVVSMSWGSAKIDEPTAANDAAVFAAGAGTPVYVAATGDNGYFGSSPDPQTLGTPCTGTTSDLCANYPAAFPNVVAAGGTSVTPNGSGWTSRGWVDAGSGCTADPRPSWQVGVTTCNGRAVADVSALADPGYFDPVTHRSVGLGLFVWLDDGTGTVGAADIGGTSLATPIVAALYALEGNSTVGPAAPYADRTATNLTDVVDTTASHDDATGSCSTLSWCDPAAGWDGPTGIGTPRDPSLFSSVAPSPSTAVLSPQQGVDLVAHTGQPVHAAPLSVSGGGSPSWSATGLPPGLSIDSSGFIMGTPTTAGHSSVTISAAGASEVISVDVYDALTLTDGAIAATVGSPVSVRPIGVRGGSGTLDWAFTSAPPAWLRLDPSTGTFSGTPSASDLGTSTVTLDALDHADPTLSGSATVTITVAPAPPQPTPTPTPTPSPAPGPTGPVATTVRLTTGRLLHTKRPRVTVAVLGGSPAGTVAIYDGGRRIATATVTPLNHAGLSVVLKKLARGRHHLRVVFTPSVTTVTGSAESVTAQVR